MRGISIKINIADRIYPLSVSMDEEEIIRKAAKLINDRIKEFQENYAVRDKQDLLSMCVLHYAIAVLKLEYESASLNTVTADKLHQLGQLLSNFV